MKFSKEFDQIPAERRSEEFDRTVHWARPDCNRKPPPYSGGDILQMTPLVGVQNPLVEIKHFGEQTVESAKMRQIWFHHCNQWRSRKSRQKRYRTCWEM